MADSCVLRSAWSRIEGKLFVNRLGFRLATLHFISSLPNTRHDFEPISFDMAEFDVRLGTPGLHRIRPTAERIERKTILRPDIRQRCEVASLWRNPEFNTQRVDIG